MYSHMSDFKRNLDAPFTIFVLNSLVNAVVCQNPKVFSTVFAIKSFDNLLMQLTTNFVSQTSRFWLLVIVLCD